MILLDDIEEKVYWGLADRRRCTSYEHVGPMEMKAIFAWDKLESQYVGIINAKEYPEPQGD